MHLVILLGLDVCVGLLEIHLHRHLVHQHVEPLRELWEAGWQPMLDRAHQNNLLQLTVNDQVQSIELRLSREERCLAIFVQEGLQPSQIIFLQGSEHFLDPLLVPSLGLKHLHNLSNERLECVLCP